MTKILVITSILPVEAIVHKRGENDILLIVEEELKDRYKNFDFKYVFVFPYANKILSKLSAKWKEYFHLKSKETYSLRGRSLFLLPIFLLPRRLPFRNLLALCSLYLNKKRIAKLIEEFKPTVIHAQSADVEAFIAKRISKNFNIPYIVTLRGLHLGADRLVKSNLKDAKELVGISPSQLENGRNLMNKEVRFIPHGIKNSFFVEKEDKTHHFPIRMITVSRLLKLKNIDMVIESLSNFNREFIFDIYGEGPEYEHLASKIKKFGLIENVSMKGYIENEYLPDKFKDYDIFVMPSYPETLGRVYFEAMASGLPVIGSKNTGIDGLVKNGKEGFIIDHTSMVEMNSVLNLIVSNPNILVDCGKNARMFAENYNWDKICDKYYNLYN